MVLEVGVELHMDMVVCACVCACARACARVCVQSGSAVFSAVCMARDRLNTVTIMRVRVLSFHTCLRARDTETVFMADIYKVALVL